MTDGLWLVLLDYLITEIMWDWIFLWVGSLLMTRMICGIQIWAHNTRYNVLQIRGIRRDIKFCEEITRCRDIPSYCHKFHFFPIEKKKNVVRPIDWQWRSSNRSISLFTCDYNWSDRDCLGCQFGRSTDCYRHHFIVVWYYGFDNGALTSPDLFPSSPAIATHPIRIMTMMSLSSTVLGFNCLFGSLWRWYSYRNERPTDGVMVTSAPIVCVSLMAGN
jgi:hypothetical protein